MEEGSAGSARIAGVVLDSLGQPVPGAVITWRPGTLEQDSDPWSSPVDLLTYDIARCDDGGGFSAEALLPGRAVLAVCLRRQAILGDLRAMKECAPVEVDLRAGESLVGIVFTVPLPLSEAAVLTCRVVDDLGAVRGGVPLWAGGTGLMDAWTGAEDTDDRGLAEIRAFPGTVVVRGDASMSHEGAEVKVVAAPRGIHAVELRTPRARRSGSFSLRVKVQDEDGRGLEGAGVHLILEEGLPVAGESDREGICILEGIPKSAAVRARFVSVSLASHDVREPLSTPARWPVSGRCELVATMVRHVRVLLKAVPESPAEGDRECGLGFTAGRSASSVKGRLREMEEEGVEMEIPPGPAVLRAHAPGFELTEVPAVIRREDEGRTFRLRLRPLRRE